MAPLFRFSFSYTSPWRRRSLQLQCDPYANAFVRPSSPTPHSKSLPRLELMNLDVSTSFTDECFRLWAIAYTAPSKSEEELNKAFADVEVSLENLRGCENLPRHKPIPASQPLAEDNNHSQQNDSADPIMDSKQGKLLAEINNAIDQLEHDAEHDALLKANRELLAENEELSNANHALHADNVRLTSAISTRREFALLTEFENVLTLLKQSINQSIEPVLRNQLQHNFIVLKQSMIKSIDTQVVALRTAKYAYERGSDAQHALMLASKLAWNDSLDYRSPIAAMTPVSGQLSLEAYPSLKRSDEITLLDNKYRWWKITARADQKCAELVTPSASALSLLLSAVERDPKINLDPVLNGLEGDEEFSVQATITPRNSPKLEITVTASPVPREGSHSMLAGECTLPSTESSPALEYIGEVPANPGGNHCSSRNVHTSPGFTETESRKFDSFIMARDPLRLFMSNDGTTEEISGALRSDLQDSQNNERPAGHHASASRDMDKGKVWSLEEIPRALHSDIQGFQSGEQPADYDASVLDDVDKDDVSQPQAVIPSSKDEVVESVLVNDAPAPDISILSSIAQSVSNLKPLSSAGSSIKKTIVSGVKDIRRISFKSRKTNSQSESRHSAAPHQHQMPSAPGKENKAPYVKWRNANNSNTPLVAPKAAGPSRRAPAFTPRGFHRSTLSSAAKATDATQPPTPKANKTGLLSGANKRKPSDPVAQRAPLADVSSHANEPPNRPMPSSTRSKVLRQARIITRGLAKFIS